MKITTEIQERLDDGRIVLSRKEVVDIGMLCFRLDITEQQIRIIPEMLEFIKNTATKITVHPIEGPLATKEAEIAIGILDRAEEKR